jgi:glycolate oxidase FAD binding subunit
MLTPTTETEAAELIRDHASRKTPLHIRGGGSRAGFGNSVAAQAILSSSSLNGIVAVSYTHLTLPTKA